MTFNKNINDLFNKELDTINSKFSNPSFYINRELSWIDFNKRVLFQSLRKDVPLLERLKFLGITASNLDEFIMVRFSSILNRLMRDEQELDISGMDVAEEYEKVFKGIVKFKDYQEDCYEKLLNKLEKSNISIMKYNDLEKKEKEYVEKLFTRFIYPLLTPITFDTTKDFPLIRSKQLSIVVCVGDKHSSILNVMSIIPIDRGLERLYKIETDTDDNKYILLEEIIFNFLHKIFINKNILYSGCIRIVREADIELEQDRDIYIVDRMRQTLINREFSDPIFMEVSNDMPKEILRLLTKIFDLPKNHIYKCKTILDLSFLTGMPIRDANLEYESFSPQYPEDLIGEHDMFTAIDNNDIVLHHPYESFGPVVKFLEHAADDKDVLAIKQTLYRVSSEDSPIVEALCRAAQKGKQVSVLLEIKARFDEDRNISLIDKLKISGCKIIYGIEELKTHCKFILVVRRSDKGLKTYCHIGTGNYNDKTSSTYTDLSFFTSSGKIAEDIIAIFNTLSGSSEPGNEINKIYYAPYNIRSKIYEMIDREIANIQKGKKGYITLKLNSLSDLGIIKKLYMASEQGVKITIFCRGICSMKAINKNISIKSIVGRYLEHSRIYFFYNNGKSDIFISSADMLTRNLDRRVELMVPITEQGTKQKVMDILMSYFKDNFNTYIMNEEGEFKFLKPSEHSPFNIHEHFMTTAINNFKFRSIQKISFKNKKK